MEEAITSSRFRHPDEKVVLSGVYGEIVHTPPIARELPTSIDRKTAEVREAESTIRAIDLFNHCQPALKIEAVKSPGRRYTIKEHQNVHGVVDQTARTDLLDLANRGVVELKKKGEELVFRVPNDIGARLERLEGSEG